MERDNIIKALECCSKDDCDNCPNPFGNCYANLAGYALSLIKELTEENERLFARNLDLAEKGEKVVIAYKKLSEENERLRQSRSILAPIRAFTAEEIDQIAKEMLEGE